MEDNVQDVESTEVETETAESTEVVAERELADLSIRQALRKQFRNVKENDSGEKASEETKEEAKEPVVTSNEVSNQERMVFAPPADMNKAEKEAFLNPIVLKIPLLLSLFGIGFRLNQPPLAYIKKSSPGLTVVSRLVTKGSIKSASFWLQLSNKAAENKPMVSLVSNFIVLFLNGYWTSF